jgi:Polyketide cyclase / dehydrase and lipid transport
MRQELTTDTVERYIEAPSTVLYDILSDVTRTPERTPDIVRCEWIDGATGPAPGARFKAINKQGRGPNWSNKPVVTVADPGREFTFTRTEPFAGTIEWKHVLTAESTGTRVTESYTVLKPLTIVGWFIIGTLYGMKDRSSDLHNSMVDSLARLAEIAEREGASRTEPQNARLNVPRA